MARTNCTRCNSDNTRKHGFDKSGARRFRCLACRRSFTEERPGLLGRLRISDDKALMILNCLVEGVGVRSTARLVGVHKNTVLAVIVEAGKRCARFLDEKVKGVSCDFLEIDELWSFVQKKEKRVRPIDPKEWGDAYLFYGLDMETKLIVNHHIGRRDGRTAREFMFGLADRLKSRAQITSDSFPAFESSIQDAFAETGVDYCQLQKIFGSDVLRLREGYLPSKLVALVKETIFGAPDEDLASTSHIERSNLSFRTSLARYTRLSLRFSKKLRNLKAAVAVYVAHYNYSRIHSAIQVTPAMEAGLTDRLWSMQDILGAA